VVLHPERWCLDPARHQDDDIFRPSRRDAQSVALSYDGNVTAVGTAAELGTYIFTRSNGIWHWPLLNEAGKGEIGDAGQGYAVALSASANTVLAGGPFDNTQPNGTVGVGAAWVFARTPTNTHDYNVNGHSDVAWRDTSGNLALWLMNGATVSSSAALGAVASTWSVVGQRDFNGDGDADLLWRDTSGNTAVWFLSGTHILSSVSVGTIPVTWSVIGTGDFDGDGFGDILWQDKSGNLAIWLMDGNVVTSSAELGNLATTVWSVAGIGDFNGDGKSDLLWRDTSGNTSMWFMNGTAVASAANVGNVPANWSVAGTGDFNGDNFSDLVWRDNDGNTAIWLMNGASVTTAAGIGVVPTTWSLARPATTMGTASAICCGAITSATRRFGSWTTNSSLRRRRWETSRRPGPYNRSMPSKCSETRRGHGLDQDLLKWIVPCGLRS
jgi:hypothetical protein